MELPSDTDLLASIDAFLARHDMAPTRLGREATGEPQLIDSIRGGRSPSLKVWRKVADFMRRYDDAADLSSTGKADEVSGQAVGA
ncbi:MAG: hypothetical protein J0H88_08525 [Sphingomonadales bacterium]|nr:hypothetical protein [Sphingomonadales bacterium]